MSTQCPSCGVRFQVDDHPSGQRIPCPQCGHVFLPPPPAPPNETISAGPAAALPPPVRPDRSFSLSPARAAIILIILSGGVGLAVGLNVHPPDQHELETGIKQGIAIGYQDGLRDASDACQRVLEKQYQDCDRQSRAQLATAERELTSQFEQSRLKLIRTHDERLHSELADATQQAGREAALATEQRLAAIHLQETERRLAQLRVELSTTCQERLHRAKKQAYDDGLLAGGYQQGYDSGIVRGTTDCEADCRREWDASLAAARAEAEAAGYERGLGEGRKQGQKDGDQKGFARGKEAGAAIGYRAGYKKGYADGLEGRKQP